MPILHAQANLSLQSAVSQDLIIRPSGVWDTRAPFHNWLVAYKSSNRVYELSVLCTERVDADLSSRLSDGRSTNKYIKRDDDSTGRSMKAWAGYRGALGKAPDGSLRSPTAEELKSDLDAICISVRQATLIRLYSAFESFLNCWALNYLLARLESGASLSRKQADIASALSPVHGRGQALHIPALLKGLPEIAEFLSTVPTTFKHPVTKQSLTTPYHPRVNARDAVDFWREYRNHLVHRDGFCSQSFFNRHQGFWDACFSPAGAYIPQLQPWRPLPLFDKMLQSCQLALYRAALALSDKLEAESGGRRGHPWAPGPKPANTPPLHPGTRTPPMLLQGDHPDSLKWISDPAFRQAIFASRRGDA